MERGSNAGDPRVSSILSFPSNHLSHLAVFHFSVYVTNAYTQPLHSLYELTQGEVRSVSSKFMYISFEYINLTWWKAWVAIH